MGKSVREWTTFVIYELLFAAPYLSMLYAWDKGLLPSVKPGDPAFVLGWALGFTVFLVAASLLRLSNWVASLPAGRQRFDLCSVESFDDKDPSRKKLFVMLLAAIRDGRTRLRLEPSGNRYRVYGTDNKAENELVPLELDVGSKIITAMKAFAGQNAADNVESGMQFMPILVGGHPVTLSLQALSSSDGKGFAIGIEDHSLSTKATESDNAGPRKNGATERTNHLRRWLALHCEGCECIDVLQQELQCWLNRIGIRLDQSSGIGSEGPGWQAEGAGSASPQGQGTPDETQAH